MVLIFDLDDTLYDEMSFVKSGLNAVAQYGAEIFGWSAPSSFNFMIQVLRHEGRGHVFDRWLQSHGCLSRARVAECVKIYRHHRPCLQLYPAARLFLDRFRGYLPLYLVTDGHKIVQKNKVDALGIAPEFRRLFITHRFGIRHAKPSLYCFDLIRKVEACRWTDMIYVGDNPAKDFVNLNLLGVLTIRVLTGGHRQVVGAPGYDAKMSISGLEELPGVLAACFGELPALTEVTA